MSFVRRFLVENGIMTDEEAREWEKEQVAEAMAELKRPLPRFQAACRGELYELLRPINDVLADKQLNNATQDRNDSETD